MDRIPNMKTGFSNLIEPSDVTPDPEFMRMVVSLMTILCEEACKSAARFCESCGRSVITGNDMLMALKYESHKFWDKDIDNRFIENMQEERNHTYETSDDDESEGDDIEEPTDADREEGGDEGEGDEEEAEFYTTLNKDCIDVEFYNEVMRIDREWTQWNPIDPIKQMLKRAIESTEERFS